MKKKIIAFAVLVLCTCVFVSSTLAYFTDEDTATNVFTTSGINIELQEWTDEQYTQPFVNPVKVMPGSTVDKYVIVHNVERPAYIRARYEIKAFKTEDGEKMPLSDVLMENLTKNIELDLSSSWTAHQTAPDEPVWYYYNESVATDSVTQPLFTKVTFDGPNIGNEYQNCEIEINLYAEAVQSQNNPIPTGKTVADVGGWN